VGLAGRVLRLADGRAGRFGRKAQSSSLADFVQAACAGELGLSNPGHPQPAPLNVKPPDGPPGLDLTQEQCDQLTAFVASLPRPVERLPEGDSERRRVAEGKRLFETTDCVACHTPKLGDVEGIYSDLLLHDMGEGSAGGGYYGFTGSTDTPPRPCTTAGPPRWRTPSACTADRAAVPPSPSGSCQVARRPASSPSSRPCTHPDHRVRLLLPQTAVVQSVNEGFTCETLALPGGPGVGGKIQAL
jgi:hypothetical protein